MKKWLTSDHWLTGDHLLPKIGKHSADWCHLCGERRKLLVDVFYPLNAEHQRNKPRGDRWNGEKYVRICAQCVHLMLCIEGIAEQAQPTGNRQAQDPPPARPA